MRNVLSNKSEVFHAWANKTQESGRSGNVSFHLDVLYSYNAVIARHARHRGKTCVLFSSNRWSVTTSGHQNAARQASRHLSPRFTVPSLAHGVLGKQEHQENLAYYDKAIVNGALAFGRARSNKDFKLQELNSLVNQANAYSRFFGLRRKFDLPRDFDLEKAKEMAVLAARREKARRDRAMKEALARYEERLDKWLAGKTDHNPGRDRDGFDRLRLKGSRIQTTSGAIVSVDEAKVVLPYVRAQIPTNNGHLDGVKIAGFQVRAIDEGGTLHVGCHKVSRNEIERIAEKLKL